MENFKFKQTFRLKIVQYFLFFYEKTSSTLIRINFVIMFFSQSWSSISNRRMARNHNTTTTTRGSSMFYHEPRVQSRTASHKYVCIKVCMYTSDMSEALINCTVQAQSTVSPRSPVRTVHSRCHAVASVTTTRTLDYCPASFRRQYST